MIQFLSTENRPPTACPVAPRQDQPPYAKGEPAALFIPCYIDQFYPADRPGDRWHCSTRQGVPVVFPPAQTCCGQPAFNSGYWEEARRVIRHFCRRLRRRTAGSSAPRPPARRCAGCSSATSTPTPAWSPSAAGSSS